MFQVVRLTNIGTWTEPYWWGLVLYKCKTKDEALQYIQTQPNWLQRECKIEEVDS
jgi:hypothetical protein